MLPATQARAEDPKVPPIDPAVMTSRGRDRVLPCSGPRARQAGLDRNHEQLRSAHRVAAYLIAYAATLAPEAAGWTWTIHVETRDEPVAWCLPGGKIMLSTRARRSHEAHSSRSRRLWHT